MCVSVCVPLSLFVFPFLFSGIIFSFSFFLENHFL